MEKAIMSDAIIKPSDCDGFLEATCCSSGPEFVQIENYVLDKKRIDFVAATPETITIVYIGLDNSEKKVWWKRSESLWETILVKLLSK